MRKSKKITKYIHLMAFFFFNCRTTILSDDFDLLEGLTTGHFDAKNRLVRKISF